MAKANVCSLKAKLKDLGVKCTGTKAELQDRIKKLKNYLDRTNNSSVLTSKVSLKSMLKSLEIKCTGKKAELQDRLEKLKAADLNSFGDYSIPSHNVSDIAKVPNDNSVVALKTKLKDIGARYTGKKAELQNRLKTWDENNLSRTLFNVDTVPSLDTSPFPSIKHEPIEKLPTDELQWISQSLIDIYFTERIANKGNEKGRRLFMCDFVKDCTFYKDADNVFFIALCSAEKKKSVDYEVKIHINCRECEIMKSHCECPAGNGFNATCKHVSALLYALEYYAVTGNVKQLSSCTSNPQQWHKPSSRGRNLCRTSINEMLNVGTESIEPSAEVTNFFYNAFSKAKCVSTLARKRNCNMTAYLSDHQYCNLPLETIILNRMNAVSASDIRKFERKTRKDVKLWHRLRRTRITTSIAHDVIRTCRSKRFSTSFLARHFLNKPIKTKAIKWGLTHESTALKEYCKIMGGNFSKCGTMIDSSRCYISATPDAVDDKRETIVEIKCPHSAKDEKPQKVKYLSSGQLKTSHRYYTQVQIQMHVSQIHNCDFVVWTPHGVYIQGIKYDAELVCSYLIDCDFYYKNVFTKSYFDTMASQK